MDYETKKKEKKIPQKVPGAWGDSIKWLAFKFSSKLNKRSTGANNLFFSNKDCQMTIFDDRNLYDYCMS